MTLRTKRPNAADLPAPEAMALEASIKKTENLILLHPSCVQKSNVYICYIYATMVLCLALNQLSGQSIIWFFLFFSMNILKYLQFKEIVGIS